MKKILHTLLCLPMIYVNQSCDKYEIGEYTPLPKLHIGETFKYQCIPENYIQLEYDSLGQVAVLNFHKEEVTDLNSIEYDEHTCTFSFHKGETAKYKISWDYQSKDNVIRFIYGQNNMWYRMNNKKNEYILEANDGMAIRVVSYRSSYDSLHVTINRFCIEEYEEN